MKPKMKYPISFGKFVMVVLGCYLALEIYQANNKLVRGKIGTIFTTVSQKTVQGLQLCDKPGLGSRDSKMGEISVM